MALCNGTLTGSVDRSMTTPSPATSNSTSHSSGHSGTHPPKYGTLIPNRIFVGGISSMTSESDLKAFFSQFGSVKEAKIIADRAGVSKGYGFITFENDEDAKKILEKPDSLIFRERKLNVGPAIRKQDWSSGGSCSNVPVAGPYHQRMFYPAQQLANGQLIYTDGSAYYPSNNMAFLSSAAATAAETAPPYSPPGLAQPQPATYPVFLPSPGAMYQFPSQLPPNYQHPGTSNWAAAGPSVYRLAQQNSATALLYATESGLAYYVPTMFGQPGEQPSLEATPAEGSLHNCESVRDHTSPSVSKRSPGGMTRPTVTTMTPRSSSFYVTPTKPRTVPMFTYGNPAYCTPNVTLATPPPTSGDRRPKYVPKMVNGIYLMAKEPPLLPPEMTPPKTPTSS